MAERHCENTSQHVWELGQEVGLGGSLGLSGAGPGRGSWGTASLMHVRAEAEGKPGWDGHSRGSKGSPQVDYSTHL